MRDMNAFIDTSTEVTTEDKIITLSTCYAGIFKSEISGTKLYWYL